MRSECESQSNNEITNYLKFCHEIAVSNDICCAERSNLNTGIIWLKCFDSDVAPETNVRNGSGSWIKAGNRTLPLAQHKPGVLVLNLSVLQFIFPITTAGREL